MSFEWTSQPLSIHSIVNQYPLPVAIRSAPGFRGSSRPIILHSIIRVTYAFGRALRISQSTTTNGYGSYKPIDSEIVAVPLKYPGYFECLSSRHSAKPTGITPEISIQPIIERMQVDHRPQAFYIASPIQVYTIEINADGVSHRVWHTIDAHQIILFDKLTHVEYTPTENDNLTDEDYAYSWWFCLNKQILNRSEDVLKCVLVQYQTCYIPCSSMEEVNLIPVGQRGSNNVNKLQTIKNLIEQFPIPINIKLSQLPGSYAYKDFSGNLQLLGSRTEQFAICASLSSSHIAVCPINTPLKFVVSQISSSSSQIQTILTNCHMFSKSFDMQIRRIVISSHHDTTSRRNRSRNLKLQPSIEDQIKRFKRSNSVDPNLSNKDDQTTTTDEGYRSSSSAVKKQKRPTSVDVRENSEITQRRRTLSTDDDTTYNSLVHPGATRKKSVPPSSPPPPALPKKPANFPYPLTTSASDGGSHLIDDIDASNADGAILMDASNELFLALSSDSRLT